MSDDADKPKLTHLDGEGRAAMVDVSQKRTTHRTAVARAFVYMEAETLAQILSGDTKKGDVLAVARIAGIQAAKRTWELIPLCHQLPLTHVGVRFAAVEAESALAIEASATCEAQTGVEMEALTAASVAALTVYDMAKGIDRTMRITDMHLFEKRGGRSGVFTHPSPPGPSTEGLDWQ